MGNFSAQNVSSSKLDVAEPSPWHLSRQTQPPVGPGALSKSLCPSPEALKTPRNVKNFRLPRQIRDTEQRARGCGANLGPSPAYERVLLFAE